MNRRGATLGEVAAYLLLLPLVLPVLGLGYDLVLRPPPSQVATSTSLELDRLCDRLRRDLRYEPSWLDGDGLRVGSERWGNGDRGVEIDHAVVLRRGTLELEVGEDGWLTVILVAANGSRRQVVTGPRKEGQ